MTRFGLIFVLVSCSGVLSQKLSQHKFPASFQFGVATASYQIEGAWNLSGKGENVWDRYTHTNPELIADGSNGDIACDSYHKYKEDVQMCKHLGVNFYRISLSWSRIMPTGYPNVINKDGIDYYNNVINELLAHGIQPMITLFHWDLPQPLQDIGGWTNPHLVEHFAAYANICFRSFGDRVKHWLTFNEPKNVCKLAYGDSTLAPALNSKGVGNYHCAHTIIKSNAKVYHLYKDKYKPTQQGKCGIALDMSFWMEPATTSDADKTAAQRALNFHFGWFASPIFGTGDYPQVMKDFIKKRSDMEGFEKSRLPEFTAEEIAYNKGSSDYMGVNMYSALSVNDKIAEPSIANIAMDIDMQVRHIFRPEWEGGASYWLKVVPWAFRNTLVYIKNNYNNPEIIVTENGYSDKGELQDYNRVRYYQLYLSALLEALHDDKVNVVGYTAWSLMDNFEWMDGYTNKFGLYQVDFNSPDRTRTPKLSAQKYKEIIADRKLPEDAIVAPPATTAPIITTTSKGNIQFSVISHAIEVIKQYLQKIHG